MAPLAAPEPMNATASHSKIRVSMILPKESVVAGRHVTGKMDVECKSDKLAIGIMMVELFAFQELTSRDHSARMTFLHTRRLFQGPNLPPSNAVHAHPLPGDTPLPEGYYTAKRGRSTFLFRIPLPSSSPASVDFANGLARVRYEVRGSVGVFWKGERQLVTDKSQVGVLESSDSAIGGLLGGGVVSKAEEGAVVVGENGRFWMHGRVVGGLAGVLVAGESACVELQVKNHSNRKNSSLTLSLRRTLVLPSNAKAATEPLEISDTLLNVPYKGPEYTLSPGGEGVAHLVFDVPLDARSVRGGLYEDEDERTSEALFCVQASIEVRVTMGNFSSKDIVLDIPVTIVHPDALPAIEAPVIYPQYATAAIPAPVPAPLPYQTPYIDPHTQQVWIPPHRALPVPYQQYYSPSDQTQAYYSPHPHQQAAYNHLLNLPQPQQPPHNAPQRPSSAGPLLVNTTGPGAAGIGRVPPISGLPGPGPGVSMPYASLLPLPSPSHTSVPHHHHNRQQPTQQQQHPRPPLPHPPHQQHSTPDDGNVNGEREEGKGVVASRISSHLRESSVLVGRGRSVSPVGHRFGYTPNVGGGGEGATTAVLHSPRPRITHKQSFTKDVVDGKAMTRSERVVELEEIAAELVLGEQQEKGKGKGKGKGKERQEAHLPIGHRFSLSPQDVNKTLPVPPPGTKPREFLKPTMLAGNGAPLDSLFIPLTNDTGSAPAPPTPKATAATDAATSTDTKPAITTYLAPSPLHSPSDGPGNYQTPPTPTLVAFKRPPRLTAPGGGGGESGLDALERRLIAQVGTRKVEKGAKLPHVRDALVASPLAMMMPTPPAMRTPNSEVPTTPGTGIGTNAGVREGGGGGGTGSVSASASSEKQDESAISSLTLDERSVEGADDAEDPAVEKEREDDEQLEQESMDGGKTHRAGKSVVGVESYFHSHAPAVAQVVYPHSQLTATNSSNNFNLNTTANSNTTTLNTPTTPKKRPPPAKKSVQKRGRVAAWLGNIDPGVPPQEEIIPPSPSVVRHPDLDLSDILSGEEKGNATENGKERRHRHEGGRYRSRSSSRSPLPIFVSAPAPVPRTPPPDTNAPLLSKDKQDFSPSSAAATPASPDPRSSGFMPMETMKAQRDTITKSMTRSMMRRVGGGIGTGREMTVAKEARKVMEIWSEGLPASEEHKEGEEKKTPQYPFLVAIPPKTQTIRTDRRVSPPSATPAALPATIPESHELEPVVEIVSAPIPAHPADNAGRRREEPKSYASVANAGLGAKKKPRLPYFPPPPSRLDPEVKYDIRSARGGRGGKVTQVASLWAAVATGNGSNGANSPERPVNGKKELKDSLLDKANDTPNAAEARNAPKPGPPVFLLPKPTTATSSPLSNAAATIVSTPRAKTPQAKTPTPTTKPKTPAPTPNPTSTSTSAPATNKTLPKRPELPSIPNPAKKPSTKVPIIPSSMTKSLSVPATVSSSLATPTLTSTASLARPVGNSGSKTSTIPVGLPGIGKGDYRNSPGGGGSNSKGLLGIVGKKSGLGVVDEEAGAGNGGKPAAKRTRGAAAAAPTGGASGGGGNGGGGVIKPKAATAGDGSDAIKRPPSRDLAFGQARLRDLIKKYQGGNA